MSHGVSRRSLLVGGLGVAGAWGLGGSAATGAPPLHQASSSGSVRLMTWNIHGAVPSDEATGADQERIAAVIAAESPDILILNEVHQDPLGPGSFGDQPAQFEALLGPAGYRHLRYGIAERDLPRGGVVLPGSSTGNMIISRYPFVGDPEIVKLPNENYEPGGKDRRSMLTSAVTLPEVGEVVVHATHLSTPGSAALVKDQKEQVEVILDHLSADVPSVLAGDFNIRPVDVPDQTYSQNTVMHSWIAEENLSDTWRQVNDSADGPTFGDPEQPHPDRRIDYLFASPHLRSDSGHISQVDPYASDHFPVVVDLLPQPMRELTAITVLAGAEAMHGWAQLADTGKGEVWLSVCKNFGTATDDGTQVRASLLSHTGRVMHTVTDGGTSRDRATVGTWRGRIPPRSRLRTRLIRGETVLHTREAVIG